MLRALFIAYLGLVSVAPAALIILAVPGDTNTLSLETAPAESNLHLLFEGTPINLSNSIKLSYSADYSLREVSTPTGWTAIVSENSPTTSYTTFFFSGFSSGDPAEYHDFVNKVTFSFRFEAKTANPPVPIMVGVEVRHALFSPLFGLATTQQTTSAQLETVAMPVAVPEPSSTVLLASLSFVTLLNRRRS